MKTPDLSALRWEISQLDGAFAALARYSGLQRQGEELPPMPSELTHAQISTWLEASASQLAMELEYCFTGYQHIHKSLQGIGPALLHAPSPDEGWLVLLRSDRKRLSLLAPTLEIHKLPIDALAEAFCAPLHAQFAPTVEALLQHADIPAGKQTSVSRALLARQANHHTIKLGWPLRMAQHARLLDGLQDTHIPRYGLGILSAQAARYGIMLGSWWLLGQSILTGQFSSGWMLAWFLLLLSMLPFSLLSTWWQGMLSLEAGSFLKQKLLFGALRLNPDDVSTQGKGHWLAQVIESDAVETLLFNGGFLSLIACIELSFAALIMGMGSGGGLRLALFVGWLALCLFLTWRNYHLRQGWTEKRIALTNDLVERMVGHRTRIAQEARERWHQGEDQVLEDYLQSAKKMDQSAVWLGAMLPRGWLLLGLLSLLPTFLEGQAPVYQLALGLGGVLLAYQAFDSFINGLSALSGAWIAWRKVTPLFEAASKPISPTSPFALHTQQDPTHTASTTPLLEVSDLSFRYHERAPLILHRCHLSLQRGERILLEGPSGGGKSTFANLLLGIREPSAGLMLLGGFDRHTLGTRGWQERVTAAPQFHENHILTHTFAFNLLMGRHWPPTQEDLKLAQDICLELGLGPLLNKMPAGLSQMIGESGWQLSHGEKSRLFIARALLQESDLIILDESFGSLDPETLKLALECVLRRAPSLIVIAHP